MKKKTKKSEIKKKITNKATEFFSPKKPDYTSSVIAAGGIAIVVLVVAASAISFQFSPGRGFLLSPDSKTGKNLELVPGMHMGSEGMADADNMAENMMDHQGMVMQKAEAIADSNRIKFKVNQFKKLAAQPLEFEVFDENGTSLKPDDLQTVHEKKLHLIIVSADLRDYQHLHPYFEGGKWKVLAKLLAPGTYYAYAEITPVVKGGQVEAREVVLRSDLIVQNPTTGQINYIGPTPNLNSYNRGYTAQLQIEKPLVYQQTKLSYQLVNKNKIAINYLRQHLGAWGHLVLIRQGDPNSFMHLHPTNAPGDELAGDAHLVEDTSTDPTKGLVRFMTSFAKPGRYSAFAEFNIAGLIYTFPMVFDITNS